jgi:hypothetical protein
LHAQPTISERPSAPIRAASASAKTVIVVNEQETP